MPTEIPCIKKHANQAQRRMLLMSKVIQDFPTAFSAQMYFKSSVYCLLRQIPSIVIWSAHAS